MGFEPQSNMGEVLLANTCAAIAEDSSGDWSTNTSTVNVILTNGLYGYDQNGNLTNDGFKYRFSSKEWEPNAGLYYYGYRFYDPNLQRWLNRDPLGDESEASTRPPMRNRIERLTCSQCSNAPPSHNPPVGPAPPPIGCSICPVNGPPVIWIN